MTSEHMALTRAGRAVQVINPNKSTRQTVPAFLNKLYNMVNDASTAHLIKWSDEGDSFYVFNHEQFAREVLGRWFKHQNFSSFVRQLNMYGFHKIPHLQQGVLKTDSETELWHFENSNFHRGQPDLLCYIQRKKQPNGAEDTAHDSTSGTNHIIGSGNPGSINAGAIDVHGIVNGINAIKRHQTAISADLKMLQESNQLLWQEALEARARHKKHQDTINRILKFLAGVFSANSGNSGDGSNPGGSGQADEMAIVPRSRARLMISDGRDDKTKNDPQDPQAELGKIELLTDELFFTNFEEPQPTIYTPTVETPGSPDMPTPFSQTNSSATSGPSHSFISSPQIVEHEETPQPPPLPPVSQPQPKPASSNSFMSLDPPVTSSSSVSEPHSLANSDVPNDSYDMSSLFNSTDNFQRLFGFISGQQPIPMTFPSDPQTNGLLGNGSYGSSNNQLTVDFPQGSNVAPARSLSPTSAMNLLSSVFLPTNGTGDNDAADGPDFNSLAETEAQLQKSYKDSSAITAEVNALQSNLYSLIDSLGLDEHVITQLKGEEHEVAGSGKDDIIDGAVTGVHPAPPSIPDFDIDTFMQSPALRSADFDQLANNHLFDSPTSKVSDQDLISYPRAKGPTYTEPPPHSQPGAFLDEVNSAPSNASSPDLLFGDLPEVLPIPTPPASLSPAKTTKKRKSDASTGELSQLKTKRKR